MSGNSPAGWIVRWSAGLLFGTILVWVTSPLFVRTYATRVWDPVRDRMVYPEGIAYRWRSEGYATSMIGPHGWVGRTDPPHHGRRRIALWGDSQAEGVGLPDREKLWSVIQLAVSGVDVIPLAESGDDAWDWITQFAAVEAALGIDSHFILVHELVDLQSLEYRDQRSGHQPMASSPWIDRIPDFVIEAGRRMRMDGTDRGRRWRFSIGPVGGESDSVDVVEKPFAKQPNWSVVAERLRSVTNLPIVILYAPSRPFGSNSIDPPVALSIRKLRDQFERHGIGWLDCRDRFDDAIKAGVYPVGFQNGRIGSGHLNAAGYRLIAAEIENLNP